jgi:molybdopterin converting factor subunit 1
VTVRLFARLREAAGRSEWDCDVPPGASVADVWRALTAQYPSLEPFGGSVTCAINADFAKPAAHVREGDEVAFLPPVSGGWEPWRRGGVERKST